MGSIYNTIINPIAWVFGKILDFLFMGLHAIGLGNIAIAIIVFTFLVHRVTLAKQAKKSFEKVFDKKVTMGLVEARNARKEDNRGRMQPITKVTMKMQHPVREDLLRYLQSNITA